MTKHIYKLLIKYTSLKFFFHVNYYYIHLKTKKTPDILNINNPKTFTDKILHLKLYNRFKGANNLVDKFQVRSYIENVLGKSYLIPLIYHTDNVENINFSDLPKKFVLKANHSSAQNLIVKDSNALNFDLVKKTLNSWLNTDYENTGEWQYDHISKKILVEKFLENDPDNPLYDYKFFCFNGKPLFIQVDIDRETNHKRIFYDLNWKKLKFNILYETSDLNLIKPINLDKMIICAQKIALDLLTNTPFVRVDLYDHNEEVKFGEITFHPEGGFGPVYPKKFNKHLGDLLQINNLHFKKYL